MKHNKKKNIAIIFDILLLEQARYKILQNSEDYNKIELILKKHFHENSSLLKEYSFFNILSTLNTSGDQSKATKILQEVKNSYKNLDKDLIEKDLTLLKEDISHNLESNFYENFVNNYKIYATIYNILNECISDPLQRIKLEDKIVDNMLLEDKSESPDYLLDSSTISYNKEYIKFSNKTINLLPEQKTFLNKYINTYTNDFDFFIYLNEEVRRCKEIIDVNKSKIDSEEVKNILMEKINNLPKKHKLGKEDLEFILEIQTLASKLND